MVSASSAIAQSSVQMYGIVDAMVYKKQYAGDASSTAQVSSGGLNTSFWGMRGKEDLGGGLSALFELTSFFRVNSGASGRYDTDPLFSRSSWVGLQSQWGTVRIGRQSSLAFFNTGRFSAFGTSLNFSPSFLQNYQSSATQPLITGSGAADSVWNNVFSYTTPNIVGFTGAAYYAPKDSTSSGQRMGASLLYANGGFAAGAVFESIKSMSLNYAKPPGSLIMNESQLWNVGASYDFRIVKLFAQATGTQLSNPTTRADFLTYNVGASIPIGPGHVLLSYGVESKEQTRLPDAHRKTLVAAYDYSLSKRTDLYAAVIHDRATAMSSGTGFATGVRHRF
ncbi:porin [Pandoraea pneumonica]|uniref:Porin n=2 Tax=Pandoraea pneumonica TaxID=2508299 RepID=A0A5E4VQI5_9BURK|nr:porin [Pandoraea pneumonica]